MNDTLLQINNLAINYETGEDVVHAVNGIDLTIHKGEALGLVGETGAGKTTTALSILKLLPKYTGKILEGKILFNDVDILQATEKDMRSMRGSMISMIFQDPMTSLNPVMSIGDQIKEVIRLHNRHMTSAELEDEVNKALNMVSISEFRRNEYPHQFSGGMKQRVMIAIAIACKPELLIADEPTTALDVTIQAQVLNMMRELRKELQSSILLITHDLGVVANFCDHVAIMYAGEIVEVGTLEDIFDKTQPHHPYTVGLFGSLPDLNVHSRRLSPIPGLMPDPTNLPVGCKFNPRCPYCFEPCTNGLVPTFVKGSHKIKCHLLGSPQAE